MWTQLLQRSQSEPFDAHHTTYGVAHDSGTWETAEALLSGVPSDAGAPVAHSWADTRGGSPGPEDGTGGTFACLEILQAASTSWTGKGSGGAQVGRHCTMTSDHQNMKRRIQASGHTVGSVLGFLFHLDSQFSRTFMLSGRTATCRLCRMFQQFLSSLSHHICSGCSCP